MINEFNTNHTKLFKSLQYLRLQNSLSLVEKDLSKNQATMINDNDGIIKNIFSSIGNEFKSSKSNKLYMIKDNIEREKRIFLNNTKEKLYSEKEISSVVHDIFKNDNYYLEKTIFSISLVFDGEYKYEYSKETLEYISLILWGNNDHLLKTRNSIENIYKDLAKQPLSTSQKILLGGTAAIVLLTATLPALSLSGLAASGITSGLAGFGAAVGLGGTMVEGIGLMAIAELLLDGAIIGFTYALLDNYNKNIVKKSFRDIDYNSAAKMLAIRCYVMYIAKQTMPKELFKEKTSEFLQMLQDLKSDTDYFLLVENENVEENKKKVRVFHNLDEKLSKIFC